jgi:hypothetical protein
MTLQRVFCPRGKSRIHPVTGAALFFSEKADALKLEFGTDQFIKTNSTYNHIPAVDFGPAVPDVKSHAKLVVNLLLEESDLAFVVVSESEVPIPDNAFPRDTDQFGDFRHGIGSRRLLVMANEVVPFRNKQMANLEIGNDHRGTIIPVCGMFNAAIAAEHKRI